MESSLPSSSSSSSEPTTTSKTSEPTSSVMESSNIENSSSTLAAPSIIATPTSTTEKILPSLNSMRKLIERTRRSRSKEPEVPCKISELKIPFEYRYIVNGIDNIDMEDFLFYDSSDDITSGSGSGEDSEQRFLIFSTKQYLDILQDCFIWFSDSSYDCEPPLFESLYIMYGLHSRQLIPLVFVLIGSSRSRCNNNATMIYRKLFQQLKVLRPGLNPTILMSNFAEVEEKENFILEFPHATQFGSFFHHYQRLLRKLQTMPEIYKKFTADLQYQIKIKMICALAFVPVDCVGWAFEMLIADPLYNDVELHLINYCSEEWINGTMITRIERKLPDYPPPDWNCFETGKLLHSTANNEIHNWHHRFNSLLKTNQSTKSIWKLISSLKREIPGLNKLISRPVITKEKKKTNRQFCQLIKSWDEESIKPGFNVVQYLQQISANI